MRLRGFETDLFHLELVQLLNRHIKQRVRQQLVDAAVQHHHLVGFLLLAQDGDRGVIVELPRLDRGVDVQYQLQLVQVRQASPLADILKDIIVGGTRVVLEFLVEGFVANGLLFAHQVVIIQVFAPQDVSSFQRFLLMRKKILPRAVDTHIVGQIVVDSLPLAQ